MSGQQTFDLMLVDNHRLLREGLSLILDRDPEFRVVGHSSVSRDVVQLYSSLRPDLVLMDPNGSGCDCASTICEIIDLDPEAKILVLTSEARNERVFEVLKAGARGFLLKESGWEEIRRALHSVLNGHCYLTPLISGKIVDGFLQADEHAGAKGSEILGKLTPRERDVLRLIAQRLPNREIADKLFVSIKTVEKHRSNIMRKLGLKTASELLTVCMSLHEESGLLN